MANLSEAAVQAVLDSKLAVVTSPQWREHGTSFKADLPVENPHRLPLRLSVTVSARLPGHYSFALLHGNQRIRALDVRGSHKNRCRGSYEAWTRRTHKHAWTDACAEAWAFTPADIPPTPGTAEAVIPGEYRQSYEAFLAECHIDQEAPWVDPEQPRRAQELGEVG